MEMRTLYVLYFRKFISRKQFFILRKRIRSEQLAFEEDDWEEEAFDLDRFTDKECRTFFRFKRADLPQLQQVLRIPDTVKTSTQDTATGMEAMCIVLRRLGSKIKWIEMRPNFGRSQGSLSRLFYATLRIIDRSSIVMRTWNHEWLQEENFATFADAVVDKGARIPNVFGFVDGTARRISRPIYHQKQMYSGHKRWHCTKWQSIVIPNGLIVNLYGGERGNMHDSLLFNESKVVEQLKEKQATFAQKFCLYGDGGYARKDGILQKPYSALEVRHSVQRRLDNSSMSTVRQSVEWGFCVVTKHFPFVDDRVQMKLYEKPVNQIYRVAVLLVNCRNCVYPNQISKFFGLEPPTLYEYFSHLP